MRSFSELLQEYITRTGISDAELARAIGVRRQTIFRWKEGTVARPRSRDDVLALSQKLRLSPAERDELLIAAGFHPEGPPPGAAPPHQETSLPAPTAHLRASLPTTFPPPGLDEDDEDPPSQPRGTHPTEQKPSRLRPLWFGLSALLFGALLLAMWASRREPLPAAAPGETLVIVGEFANFTGGEIGFNVAGRIADPLRQEVAQAGLAEVRVALWPELIRSEVEAQSVLARSAGWMVIWGEYDSGRVLARFVQNDAATPPPVVESLVASPDELFATINSEAPQEVRYLALLTLGAYYMDSGRHAQSRAILERAYASPPQEVDAQVTLLFRLGLAHQLGADPQRAEAIRYYTELLAIAPDHLLARYNRGLAYLDSAGRDRWRLALADFDGTLRRSPTFLAARIGRGVAYLYRRGPGDDEAALQDFSFVIERDSERTLAYFNRGLLAIRTDRRDLWEADLAQVIELAPAFAPGHSGLCWGYVLDNEAEKALPYCDAAVNLGAQEALHSRGIAYALQGDLERASQELRAFLAWLEAGPVTNPYAVYAGQVRGWLTALDAGTNPIDAQVLAELRGQ